MTKRIYFERYQRLGQYPTYVTVGEMIDALKEMPHDAKVVLTTRSELDNEETKVPIWIDFSRNEEFYLDEDVVDIRGS